MKILFVFMMCLPAMVYGQWSGPDADGKIFYNGGSVGIGLQLPVAKLDIIGNLRTTDRINAGQYIAVDKGGSYRVAMNGQADGYITGRNDAVQYKFLIHSNGVSYLNGGNVGIGMTSPGALLDIKYKDLSTNLYRATDANGQFRWRVSQSFHMFLTNSAGADIVKIGQDNSWFLSQNVGIGTTNTEGYRFAVAGKAIAEEVVVKLEVNWPDYVFDDTYKRLSLSQLEQFILKNKHLPDVPTAEEVQQDGLSLGAMNAVLLKKVEELTLYLIELKNQNDELTKRVEQLEKL